jgi:hypothetical protein
VKRTALVFPTVAVALAAGISLVAGPFEQSAAQSSAPTFEARFETASDFYDRFDYGYSGQNPWNWGNGSGEGAITSFHGDHDMACEGPTTQREVKLGGDQTHLDYSQMFWFCAPGGDPTKGHLMTGVDTVSYNIAWFSPKPLFTDVTQVCWAINETQISQRKWTQVMFVSEDDAVRYPASPNETPGSIHATRGSGGYDLGYTSPDFRDPNGPVTGIFADGGTLAGFKSVLGNAHWFQDQDTWTTREPLGEQIRGVTDKAKRYRHCLSNQPDDVVRLTQDTPDGVRTIDMPGQIPSGPVRVVFQDDNYNGPKDELYDANMVTWHWDDIEVAAEGTAEMPPPPASAIAPPDPRPSDASSSDAVPAGGEVASAPASASSDDGLDLTAVLLAVAVLSVVAMVLVFFDRTRPLGGPPLDRGDADQA